MKTLGQKFKLLRQKKQLNQKAMADFLELSIPAYSKLETGTTDPNFSRINQIAKFHGLTLNQLLVVGEDQVQEEKAELTQLRARIRGLEEQVLDLQGKLIQFYEEESLRKKNS